MIVVDTSALMAVLLDEPAADAIAALLEQSDGVIISAGTLAEARIVAARRGLAEEMAALLDAVSVDVQPVTAASAAQVSDAYAVWGKGIHPAGLNFGDCFAYATAASLEAALLYVGEDFGRTDIGAAL